MPSGVEEAVIIVEFCDSEARCRDGIRGGRFAAAAAAPGATPPSGEDDGECGDGEQSGAAKDALSEEETMLECSGSRRRSCPETRPAPVSGVDIEGVAGGAGSGGRLDDSCLVDAHTGIPEAKSKEVCASQTGSG